MPKWLVGWLLPVLLLLSTAASGQRVLLGLKGGGAFSKAIGPDATASRLRLGATVGLLVRLELPVGLALQAEGLYAQRGDNGNSYGFSVGHRLDYLAVPLLLQYHRDGLFVEGGAQYGYLLRATPNEPPAIRLDELAFEPRDLNFVLGVGFQDTSGVSVGWRYVGGLNNVFQPGQTSGTGQRRLRNSSLELYLNFVFEPRQVGQLTVAIGRGIGRGALGAVRLIGRAPGTLFRVVQRRQRPPTQLPAPDATPPVLPD
ncbi:porin family protein [Hymenobacter terrestris]|uniref:PorT family protein n=1 Tax=Hymenobacter terrestris TaxID=2748310 RepID=A0ABX2Q6E3_9BACT|nr:porin family protein [Hymenobacter terrestris]NVO86545.1 PorT family protein [Hymenobacter terrestris]